MKVRILHLIETLSRGGAEKRLINDLKYLDKDTFSNFVCHIFKGDDLKDTIAKDIPVYCLDLNDVSEFFKGLTRLTKLVRKLKPDIIHTQLFFADICGRVIGKLFNIRVVSTIQSSAYEPGIEYFRSLKRLWLDRLTSKFCNTKFIAVSDFVKKSAIRRLGFASEDINVIYNYIDTKELFSPQEDRTSLRRSLSLNEKDIVLITVGKLNPPKGHNYLFDAVSLIVKSHSNIKLLVVGDGPYLNELTELRNQLGLQDAIVFLRERNDIYPLLSLSDIFVFPSLSEGFPLSLLEAMAMEKPCVAFNLGPMPELIENGKSGLLVEPEDSKMFAAAVSDLIDNPQKALRFGLAARQAVFDKFSEEKNVKALSNLYQTIIQKYQEVQA